MQVILINVLELKPCEWNPRKITDWELRKLMRSIETFGFVEPVIVNKDMTIVGGHQRVEAAKHLGIEQVPCVFVDLPKNKEKSLNLALNRIGGEFDEQKLALLLKELDDTDKMLSGFDNEEIEKAIKAAEEPTDLTDTLRGKSFGMNVTFETHEDLQNAEPELIDIIKRYNGSFTVKGEI